MIGLSFLDWFRGQVQGRGVIRAAAESAQLLWQFLRESMPDRRRQRYGDIDYDWDHRVDTTAATISARNRFLGLLYSPYQPTDPALFHEMMSKLDIDFSKFVFVDIGSGKGRALLMAADYPFRRIIGVELLLELNSVAEENIRKRKNDWPKCLDVQAICGDACQFVMPAGPIVLYLFNPLPDSSLARLLENLERSLRSDPRPAYVLYHNPESEHVLLKCNWLRKISGTRQYSIYVDRLQCG